LVSFNFIIKLQPLKAVLRCKFIYNKMFLSIIITPLIVFLSLGLFGRFIGHNGAGVIAPVFIINNAFFSFIAFYNVGILGNFTCISLGS
jgi:hypothetical protein